MTDKEYLYEVYYTANRFSDDFMRVIDNFMNSSGKEFATRMTELSNYERQLSVDTINEAVGIIKDTTKKIESALSKFDNVF